MNHPHNPYISAPAAPHPIMSNNSPATSSRASEINRLTEELSQITEQIKSAFRNGLPTAELKNKRTIIEDRLEELSAMGPEPSAEYNDSAPGVSSNATLSSFFDLSAAPYNPPMSFDRLAPDASNPSCACGLPCIKLISRQDASLNREFYKCPKSDEKCGFFQWVDHSTSSNTNYRDSFDATPSGPSVAIKDPKQEIQRMFGHQGFRPGQLECIEAALQQRDVFCLMPTGGGKSIVYQLPAWCCNGLAVVFSPLLSLIQDQVDAMNAISIRSIFFNSTQDEEESRMLRSELFNYSNNYEDGNPIKLLYVTPEKLNRSPSFRNLLASLNQRGLLSRFIIGTAYLLLQLPSYLNSALL